MVVCGITSAGLITIRVTCETFFSASAGLCGPTLCSRMPLMYKSHAESLPVLLIDCLVTAMESGDSALFMAGVRSTGNEYTH